MRTQTRKPNERSHSRADMPTELDHIFICASHEAADEAGRLAVFGNSGCGKSTFARQLSARHNLKVDLDGRHVSMLFIRADGQRSGIGRGFLHIAIKTCRERSDACGVITVNSSPNAVAAYERLGFAATGNERCVHGIRFIPMQLPIADEATPFDDGALLRKRRG